MSQPPTFPEIDAQAYLAALITSIDDAIISEDLHGNITAWNPAAEKMFGYEPHEILGKHISVLIPPEHLSEQNLMYEQLRQGHPPKHYQTVRRAKSGKLIEISITVSPVRNADGAMIGITKIVQDISSFKEAERAVAYLGAIIESSDDAIISKDLNGNVTSWNRAAERIFGFSAAEVISKPITMIIPPERLEEEGKILTTLRTGERIDHFETVRRHKDGHLVPVSLTVSPIRDMVGNIIGASKISRDISERINTAKALAEASTKKDEFLTNMSHELRTPMNAVIGLSNILDSLPEMPQQAKKYIKTLKASADNMMNLINDLLDFAKIESGSLQIEEIEFDLAEQVENAVNVANVRAAEKGIALFVAYAPELNRNYKGDPLRINQVLMNLLSNAVKFTASGSVELDVRGAAGPDKDTTLVTFTVKDTGPGIPPEKLETIFEKFSQADSSITRQYGGSGLGLAIAKGCAEKMGGTITVRSAVDLGSTFTVCLPLRKTETLLAAKNFSTLSKMTRIPNAQKILLVEDYEPNILVAGTLLEQFGYQYDVARNGLEAIRSFLRSEYKLILMDLQMADMDGFEATRKIRQLEAEKKAEPVPIIAMTAHVREQDQKQCFDAGMDDFIPKPFNIESLSEKISKYLSNPDRSSKSA
jgi:PAS domain S-box-containing protein